MGTRSLNLYAFADPDARGVAGELAARISPRVSAFASAWGGQAHVDEQWQRSWGAVAGLGMRF